MAGAANKPTWRKPLIAVLLVAVIGILVGTSGVADLLDLETLKQRQAQLDGWISENLWLALALFFALYVIVTALSIPGAAVMTLAAGALFGLLAGTVLVSFASTIGATLAFLVARFLLRDSLRAKFG